MLRYLSIYKASNPGFPLHRSKIHSKIPEQQSPASRLFSRYVFLLRLFLYFLLSRPLVWAIRGHLTAPHLAVLVLDAGDFNRFTVRYSVFVFLWKLTKLLPLALEDREALPTGVHAVPYTPNMRFLQAEHLHGDILSSNTYFWVPASLSWLSNARASRPLTWMEHPTPLSRLVFYIVYGPHSRVLSEVQIRYLPGVWRGWSRDLGVF